MTHASQRNRFSLTQLAHDFVRRFVNAGDVVIDATVGNGFDTLFLCELVGEKGTVYGFDIQDVAIEAGKRRCSDYYESDYAFENGLLQPKLRMIVASHAEMLQHVSAQDREKVACVMFNLGYLPKGDKSITTQTSSTVAAIDAAFALLRESGCISLVAYTGHPGGLDEACEVERHLRDLARVHDIVFQRNPEVFGSSSPVLFTLSKIPCRI